MDRRPFRTQSVIALVASIKQAGPKGTLLQQALARVLEHSSARALERSSARALERFFTQRAYTIECACARERARSKGPGHLAGARACPNQGSMVIDPLRVGLKAPCGQAPGHFAGTKACPKQGSMAIDPLSAGLKAPCMQAPGHFVGAHACPKQGSMVIDPLSAGLTAPERREERGERRERFSRFPAFAAFMHLLVSIRIRWAPLESVGIRQFPTISDNFRRCYFIRRKKRSADLQSKFKQFRPHLGGQLQLVCRADWCGDLGCALWNLMTGNSTGNWGLLGSQVTRISRTQRGR